MRLVVVERFFQWRRSAHRVGEAAIVLLREHGDHAVFLACEREWAALQNNDKRQALYWRAVRNAIGRRLAREALVAGIPSQRDRLGLGRF